MGGVLLSGGWDRGRSWPRIHEAGWGRFAIDFHNQPVIMRKTMGVPYEGQDKPKHLLKIIGVSIARQASGRWSVRISIAGKVTIDALRSLEINREVSLMEVQRGSKPRGRASWRKTKGAK